MSGETEASESGWTVDTLRADLLDRLVLAEKHRLELAERDMMLRAERDRRYAEVRAADDRRLTEVAVEREKALKIKETADLAALQLAREIQTYKDEKANELRSQIERERGSYATQADLRATTEKLEAIIKPLADWVINQQGARSGVKDNKAGIYAAIGAAVALITVVVIVANFLAGP